MLPLPNETYINLIIQTLPDASPEDISTFNGWDYVVFVIANKYAFRFPRNQKWSKNLPSEAKFSQEFSKYSSLRIPVQELRNDDKIGVYSFYEFIPGRQLDWNTINLFPKKIQVHLAQEIGRFLTSLHTFPVNIAKKCGVEIVNASSFWEDRLAGNRKYSFPLITDNERQWVENLFSEFLSLIQSESISGVPTHFDFRAEHIIINSDTYSVNGIIDISGCIADPAYDFTILGGYSCEFLSEVYKNYNASKDRNFEIRRQFYTKSQVVYDIENYSALNDTKELKIAINRLKGLVKGD